MKYSLSKNDFNSLNKFVVIRIANSLPINITINDPQYLLKLGSIDSS